LDRLLTVEEAADRLGTSVRFVRRLILERRIAYTKLGRHVRIAPRDLDAFIRAGRVEVDLDHGTVEVVEIVTEVSGYLHFGPPKTRAGYRRVGLPRVVVEALAEQLARPGSADDLVFVGPQGGTLRLAGFRHRIWRPATKAAGPGWAAHP
jgi:excisionase family DNA binding protein